jgi:hypothetical protein
MKIPKTKRNRGKKVKTTPMEVNSTAKSNREIQYNHSGAPAAHNAFVPMGRMNKENRMTFVVTLRCFIDYAQSQVIFYQKMLAI